VSDALSFSPALDHCLTPVELSKRWRCRMATVRSMIRSGNLHAILINGRLRVTPEAIAEAERGPIAARVVKRRPHREKIPDEVVILLSTD